MNPSVTGIATCVAIALCVMLAPGCSPAEPPLIPLTLKSSPPFEFDWISDAIVSSDGSIIVVDARARQLYRISPDLSTLDSLGTQGSGPGELQAPTRVFRYRGDSIIAWDEALRRFAVIATSTGGARTITAPEGLSFGLGPVGADTMGHIYLTALAIAPEAGEIRGTLVLRWDEGVTSSDTVAILAVPATYTSTRIRGRQRSLRELPAPFQTGDGIAVGLDGVVTVVREATYRVDRRGDSGLQQIWPGIGFTPVAISAEEKAAYPDTTVPADAWPKQKSPLAGSRLFADPRGRLLVPRSYPDGSVHLPIDIFERGGTRSRRGIPAGERPVGVGDGTVLAAHETPEGATQLRIYGSQ